MATAAAASQFTGVDFLNFDGLLSEEERAVRDTVRTWVDEHLIPVIGEAYVEGRFPKQLIPGAVAVAIVCFLEAIDINGEHGEPLVVRALEYVLGQPAAVGQCSEGIGQRGRLVSLVGQRVGECQLHHLYDRRAPREVLLGHGAVATGDGQDAVQLPIDADRDPPSVGNLLTAVDLAHHRTQLIELAHRCAARHKCGPCAGRSARGAGSGREASWRSMARGVSLDENK